MGNFTRVMVAILLLACIGLILNGCTMVLQKGRRSDMEKIDDLSAEVERLKMTEEEFLKLQEAYAALQESLRQEIDDEKVSLGIEEKGLVVTFVDSVLFDSGKAKLREEAFPTLDKVVQVCRRVVADREVGVEGHTDNQPIRYSGWKSNWELSAQRATSVLHYLEDKGISASRLSLTGYGEHRPRASNFAASGRQKNRRVEIVIVPQKITRERPYVVHPETGYKK